MGSSKRELAAKARYWGDHVSAWFESGLSQAEYCRRHDLAAHNLGYWVRKLGSARVGELSAPEATSSVELVEVDFRVASEAVPAVESPPFRIAVGERFWIEVRGDFDAAVFEKLVLSLARTSALISDRPA